MGFLDHLRTDSILRSLQTANLRNTPEVRTPVWLPVSGTIPPWLNGVLYRIGPAKYQLEDSGQKYVIRHAFDGLPFVHRFELSSAQQRIRYNSRLTAEGMERSLVHHQSKGMIFFGHIPEEEQGWSRFARMVQRLDRMVVRPRVNTSQDPSSAAPGVTITPNFPLPKDLCSQKEDRVLVAKTDANILQKINADSLEPERLFKYENYHHEFEGFLSAAHHQYDPHTDETFSLTLRFGHLPAINIFAIHKSGEVTRMLARLTHRHLPNGDTTQPILPCYIHSFWLTERYVIIPETPLHYSNNGLDLVMNGTIITGLAWKEDAPAYLHVIDRQNGGLVVSVPTEAFAMFHTANAWDSVDDDGNIVIHMDCCAFKNADFLYKLSGNSPPTSIRIRGITIFPDNEVEYPDLRRYRIIMKDAKDARASVSTLVSNFEFPRFSQRQALEPYTFAWGCQRLTDGRVCIAKANLETGRILPFDLRGHFFSESIFVPRPDATEEDDGALLSFVNTQDRCMLLVLDARTMEEIVRCDIGNFTATTFHGSYVDSDHFENISIN
ncbi:carotenoid oxygenase [Dichotomocladium elegans]|nr:carotenoid oxygenase [Dichotomocladium elegans]